MKRFNYIFKVKTPVIGMIHVEALPGTPRYNATSFTIGNTGFVGLGYDNTLNYTKDMWQYNPYSNLWTQITNFGGSAREGASAFVLNNEAYICCGFDNAYKYDVWKYTPSLDVSVHEIENVIQLIYPNPTKDNLKIVLSDKYKNSIVTVSDINGKEVILKKMGYVSEAIIDLNSLKQGVYTVNIIESSNIIATKKIIKTQ